MCIKDVNVTDKKPDENIDTKNSNVLYLKMEFVFTLETINFNIPVSLVLCNHEIIKVLSHLLVIFILYIEYPLFFFGLHPYFLIVLSAITNLSTMTVYANHDIV